MSDQVGILWAKMRQPVAILKCEVSRPDVLGEKLGKHPIALMMFEDTGKVAVLALTADAGRDLLLDLCVALDVPLPSTEPSATEGKNL